MSRNVGDRELEACARAAARGDEVAFQRLYRASVERVHGQVGRLLGWGPGVEDIVQEVFLELHKALPSFRGDSSFTTWLFRLTHNVAISHIRRSRSRPVELGPIQQLGRAIHQPDFDARNRVRALYAALEHFTTEAREAFVLYEMEGLSLKEIAELTDTPMNTVASRVRRTRERLRRLLERDDAAARKAQ